MQLLRKTATVLGTLTLLRLAAACDGPVMPTEPSVTPAPGVLSANNNGSGGTTHWVNDDDPNGGIYVPRGSSCNNPGYPKIQDAVNAAGPGDRINVCRGTYPEQVLIPATKNGIRLISVDRWRAVIKAPPIMLPGPAGTFSIVRVAGAQNVTLLAFTITGPGPGPCMSLHYGVRVDNAGSANILGNHITHIRDEPMSNCENGIAILVGRNSELETGSAQIIGNVIDNYQRIGPTVSGNGSTAYIAHNRVFGVGPTAINVQAGIQMSDGGAGTIRHNFVAQNIYSPHTSSAHGILMYQSGKASIEHNTVPSNDVGVYMFRAGAGTTVIDNRVRASKFDGVTVDGTDNSQVAHNDIDHSGGPGIAVNVAQNNTLDRNHILYNTDSGVLFFMSTLNVVSSNRVRNNGNGALDQTDGIRIDGASTANRIFDNRLKRNITHDCHDNAVGNVWTDNRGETSQPPGLCGEEDTEVASDDVMTSSEFGWNASYPWYTDYADAAEVDWTDAYAEFDTESLLALVPAIPLGTVRGLTLRPYR